MCPAAVAQLGLARKGGSQICKTQPLQLKVCMTILIGLWFDELEAIDTCQKVAFVVSSGSTINLSSDGRQFVEQLTNTETFVTIDLTVDFFVPGKRMYDNAYQAVKERLPSNFTVVLAWDPKDDKVCPSSIAAYFESCGFQTSVCRPKKSRNLRYGVDVPSLKGVQTNQDVEDFLEWLGAVSIGVPLDDSSDNYLSSMKLFAEKGSSCTAVLTWSGFFTHQKISHLLKELSDVIAERKTLPWISMHVQGFEDSALNWGLNEHRFYTDGDNSYTIISKDCGSKILASNLSNQKLSK